MSTDGAEKPKEPARQSLPFAVLSTLAVAAWFAWHGGWVWALAGAFGLLVHEYGHYAAINRAGCGPARLYLIPFFGGLALQPKPSPTVMIDVMISLAGPALGILATLPFFGLYAATKDPRWLEGAFFIAVINILQLVPARPLDGSGAIGPVLAKIHPMVERGVVLALALIAVVWALERGSFIFAGLVGLSALPILMGRPMRTQKVELTWGEARQAVLLYLATAAACFAAVAAVAYTLGVKDPFVLLLAFFG